MLPVDEERISTLPRVLSETKDSIIGIKPYPQSYTKEVLKNIKIIDFGDNEKSAQPFGSYIYRVQKYPGDIDLTEEYKGNGTIDDVIKQFKNRLVQIVKNIIALKVHYMVEFKMGLDKLYDVDIGELREGIYYPNYDGKYIKNSNGHIRHVPGIMRGIKSLYKRGLLDVEEVNKIYHTLNDGQLTGDHYDVIYNILRERMVLRWSEKEILKGEKIEDDGSVITIEQALKYKSHVKIDMITKIEDKFVEMTNFLFLIAKVKDDNGNEKDYIINFGMDYDKNFLMKRSETQLPLEIEKLFYSDYYYNPFKGAKRIWALARHYRDWPILTRLKDLISGNISLLYMLKSEIGTMLSLLKKLVKNKRNIPKASINKNLELIKERIGYVLNLNTDRYYHLVNKLNSAIDEKNIVKKIDIMDSIEYLLKLIISVASVNYLKANGFRTIPKLYMPEQLNYINNLGVEIQ